MKDQIVTLVVQKIIINQYCNSAQDYRINCTIIIINRGLRVFCFWVMLKKYRLASGRTSTQLEFLRISLYDIDFVGYSTVLKSLQISDKPFNIRI